MTDQNPEIPSDVDGTLPAPPSAGNNPPPDAASSPSPEELLARIQEMQKRIDDMAAAQGIPSDPVEAALANLTSHIEAHAAQNPSHDFGPLKEVIKLTHEALTSKDAEKIKVTVEKVMDKLRHLDLNYVLELARDLQLAVLNREG